MLIEGTNILRADPLSIVGRDKLLDSVKGILSGTTSILYVVDDAEVRKIINTSQLVVTKSAMIKSEPSITVEINLISCCYLIFPIATTTCPNINGSLTNCSATRPNHKQKNR